MKNRLKKIRKILKDKKIDGLFISSSTNITYLTGFDFLVPAEREAYVFITRKNQYIFSSFLYKEEVMKKSSDFTFYDFSSSNGQGKPFWDILGKIAEKEKLSLIGFEENNLTVAEFNKLKKQKTKLVAVSVNSMRFEKDEDEMKNISIACSLGDKAFKEILPLIKPGITEKELGFILDNEIRKFGAEPSFTTIIAFGRNAAVPHHMSNNTKLKNKDIVLLDFGAKINNYCSDMTRTVFLGKPTKKEKKAYLTVKESQEKAFDFLFSSKLPIASKDVDAASRNYILEKGFPTIPHSLGHSIGIDVHDGFRLSPLSQTELTKGMVFSIEPGIYLPNELGVRIEDIVALTDKGPEILTTSSRELLEI